METSRLVQKLTEIERLEAHCKGLRESGDPEQEAERRSARETILVRVDELVLEISAKPGVHACVAANEGLAFSTFGQALPSFDAVAAMTQIGLEAGERTCSALAMGRFRQLVMLGDDLKLVLIAVGHVVIAIQAPVSTDLSRVLSE